MKNNLAIFLGVLLVIGMSGIIYAADNENAVNNPTTGQPAKNMTYGQCVSENALIKNSCFASIKSTTETCKTQATAGQDKKAKKDTLKLCKQTLKTDKKQCMQVFKDSKKECKKIKHNFMDTIKASMK